jgi:murein DD-endopeptidase MepM/ murein hydrolase activator NlpD
MKDWRNVVYKDGKLSTRFLVGSSVAVVGIGGVLYWALSGDGDDGERLWPVVPNRGIINAFGANRVTKGRQRIHIGTDVGAFPGDKVVAIADGTVIGRLTGYELGAGLGAVSIRHPDADYIYAEIDVDPSMTPGKKVKRGDLVGVVRKNSDGTSMLHLEAWQTGTVPSAFYAWWRDEPRPKGILNSTEILKTLPSKKA